MYQFWKRNLRANHSQYDNSNTSVLEASLGTATQTRKYCHPPWPAYCAPDFQNVTHSRIRGNARTVSASLLAPLAHACQLASGIQSGNNNGAEALRIGGDAATLRLILSHIQDSQPLLPAFNNPSRWNCRNLLVISHLFKITHCNLCSGYYEYRSLMCKGKGLGIWKHLGSSTNPTALRNVAKQHEDRYKSLAAWTSRETA